MLNVKNVVIKKNIYNSPVLFFKCVVCSQTNKEEFT